ncbi:uncharacterized protein K460DRAFT_173295 [Cucurbitaria berberidis CBS 394.84]|uniref:Sensor histidine kinase/response regulator n=1 Tax=Cucurbitaria berberidis CBS 394.84 TaxID=1168544 RepID=A0A9P4L5A7_9PLEO|nr:uncharacterized protein K460DRAFT_173295 [Cucurbitaria berberidis CBS 394.84]KAF1841778.1 hypothetical protein K460DRAFT_173295 [Cucurbitaria berberidis CBS 394.84]
MVAMEDPLPPLGAPKPVADWRRERDVFDLYAAFQEIPRIDNLGCSPDTHSFPDDFVPRPASDASLAAFAQLAAMRLQAQRSMISLLDGQYQYILAEATPKTSLRFDSPLNKNLDILLGNVRIPRNWGLCERVLDPFALAEGDPGIIIIKDLSQSRLHENRSYVKEGPKFRFYAGVPITSLNGTIVGSMCIFDGPERSGMLPDDIAYLKDLAATVMEYLVTYTLKDQHRRGAEGLHGLLSFAEGDSKIGPFIERRYPPEPSLKTDSKTKITGGTPTNEERKQNPPVEDGVDQPRTASLPPKRGRSERRSSVGDLQDKIVPNTIRELFARASDIMRRSNDMDGVMFLDASVAATGYHGGGKTPTRTSGKQCQLLGFATQDGSTLKGDSMSANMIPDEANFAWLLKRYPHGYSLDCDEGQLQSWSDEEGPLMDPLSPAEPIHMDETEQESISKRVQHVLRIKALFPNIKSALFLPLWNFEHNRWFAGCFCWSRRAERNLSGPLELPFLKAFGHSIMQEVARIDAIKTSQVKTTFLSSLSHELRSPLHGILGSIQLMRSTTLDSFQFSMVNSIAVCGRTLLETVQHLLEHAERKEPSQNVSKRTFPAENTVCISSDVPALDLSHDSTVPTPVCNIGLVTEEVIETMFLGQGRYDVALAGGDVPGAPVNPSSKSEIAHRRSRFIVIDIGDYANLDFSIPASLYGRLIMNILGNALKFTESGYILVWLRSDAAEASRASVTLKINDSGIGISQEFLFNEAFEPFRKHNPHSAGTGVGLNVVQRIIEDIGGSVEITSHPGKGTDVTLRLPLERNKRVENPGSPHNLILASLSQLKSRKICILHSKPPDENGPPEGLRHWQMLTRYIDAISSTLQDELKMIVTKTSEWDGHDESDVVVCPEVFFEGLQAIRSAMHRRPPATLFIAMDTLEADTLRCDARVTSKSSIVEVMTQPCGPYKIGMAISQCLKRYDGPSAGPFKELDTSFESVASANGSQLVSQLGGPRLELCTPIAFRSKKDSSDSGNYLAEEPTLPPPNAFLNEPENTQLPKTEDSTETQQILIVDDNAINRRLLSVFMKKKKLPFKEAKDGLQALETYKESDGKFDVILMDISMPVMDGMTSTRLIREHESDLNLKPVHIIALTGLTSASARLEAWTSGVDDFLTKPVDFKQLESLMEAGRDSEETGFSNEQSTKNVDEKLP